MTFNFLLGESGSVGPDILTAFGVLAAFLVVVLLIVVFIARRSNASGTKSLPPDAE